MPGARILVAVILLLLAPHLTFAQSGQDSSPEAAQDNPPPPEPLNFNITVIGTTPLPGVDIELVKIPAPVQLVNQRDLEQSGALNLSDLMNRRMNGVHVNEVQGNPFQTDVNYRGYTASPLLGTPQGLSVYMDGVRLNQPLGEVVSWDLIPQVVISSSTLMPGSNPLFGLNTLGGALSLQTKDGRNNAGTSVEATYGGDERRAIEFEHGGHHASGLHWYAAGNFFAEDGWRQASPTDVRQLFGKLGRLHARGDVSAFLAYAGNALTGNGLQDLRFLDQDFTSIYTRPDETNNHSTFVNLAIRQRLTDRTQFTGNGYYRRIHSDTLNGDLNEDSLDQSVYQPTPAEQAALAAAGYSGFPTSGANASNTPFPFWRCIANVLLNDEPAERCNGLINRTDTLQHNAGASGQLTKRHTLRGRANQLTAGAAYDRSTVGFQQSTELGYLNPDRSVTGTGAFGDGETGGEVDGEPFDTRVDLDGVLSTWSAFATDTVSLKDSLHITLSGRYNRTHIDNRDRIQPGGGSGSLDGDYIFGRFNPAAGLTFSPSAATNLYVGYSEGSRAPTSIELGCADPDEPCKLPNAMTGDPPLEQVVTRTLEAGLRGLHGSTNWNVGAFFAANDNDILFVTSEQSGFGYFRNFGETRRQGIEGDITHRLPRVTLRLGYTFLDATYRSVETVNGENNSSNDAAGNGLRGLEGSIAIEPGDRIPLMPRHGLKAFADWQATRRLSIDVGVIAASQSFARGNENNEHEPDGIYYLGPGDAPGYAVLNLGGSYRLTSWLRVIGQVNNLFDTTYYTSAQLGPAGFTNQMTFIARPFPPVNGQFPIARTTFYAPGAPVRALARRTGELLRRHELTTKTPRHEENQIRFSSSCLRAFVVALSSCLRSFYAKTPSGAKLPFRIFGVSSYPSHSLIIVA
jgi:outer membrane receptor protein involved in Fe transport